jgi:hypothetical protein
MICRPYNWLPTSTDRFYPDFVAELKDGRTFVVEYKGEPYLTNDDSQEKRSLGELWEEKSKGKGLFLMAKKRDAQGATCTGKWSIRSVENIHVMPMTKKEVRDATVYTRVLEG